MERIRRYPIVLCTSMLVLLLVSKRALFEQSSFVAYESIHLSSILSEVYGDLSH